MSATRNLTAASIGLVVVSGVALLIALGLGEGEPTVEDLASTPELEQPADARGRVGAEGKETEARPAAPGGGADSVADGSASSEAPTALPGMPEADPAKDPETTRQPRAKPGKKPVPLAEALRKEVSLEIRQGTLGEAIEVIATSAGIEILLDPDLADIQLTMELQDVSVQNALRTLAMVAGGLEVVEEGDHVVLRRGER